MTINPLFQLPEPTLYYLSEYKYNQFWCFISSCLLTLYVQTSYTDPCTFREGKQINSTESFRKHSWVTFSTEVVCHHPPLGLYRQVLLNNLDSPWLSNKRGQRLLLYSAERKQFPYLSLKCSRNRLTRSLNTK